MKNILIVDLESTCWNNKEEQKEQKSEIIEIGYTPIINGEIGKSDSIFIKPEYSSVSNFCENLTTLSQKFIDENGEGIKEAYNKFKGIISKFDTWGSWGQYDLNQLKRMFELYKIPDFLPLNHINVKTLFANKVLGKKEFKKGSPVDALKKFGEKFDGIHHRGSDDSHNIARVYLHLIEPNNVKNIIESIFDKNF